MSFLEKDAEPKVGGLTREEWYRHKCWVPPPLDRIQDGSAAAKLVDLAFKQLEEERACHDCKEYRELLRKRILDALR